LPLRRSFGFFTKEINVRSWLLFLCLFTQYAFALKTWDALPAVDVKHIQGKYAGQSICPMCRHGYDAGMLIFVPSSTAPTELEQLRTQMDRHLQQQLHSRYRAFLVFVGDGPSIAQQQLVRLPHENWFVANLQPEGRDAALRDFAAQLEHQAHAYVFAQRRLLWQFDPFMTAPDELQVRAEYALDLLAALHPNATTGGSPDTPQGQLWLAPNQLTEAMPGSPLRQFCFRDREQRAQASALLLLAGRQDAQPYFLATDIRGCVRLDQKLATAQFRIFELARKHSHADWQTRSPDAERALGQTIYLQSTPEAHGTIGIRTVPILAPCEDCELAWVGMPKTLAAGADLSSATDHGERLQLRGRVLDQDGKPRAGVVIYLHQTDAAGLYPEATSSMPHGRLRAWVQSDAEGHYQLTTIRPGAYPKRATPAHIHMQIIEAERCSYFIGDVMFADDPQLTEAQRLDAFQLRGGSGVVEPKHSANTTWTAERDIVLGRGVDAYEQCAETDG
jgi:protocatechuate 3,4-dioxygenase beta subunit